jgi:Carboxypeptidase regulatory-like domain
MRKPFLRVAMVVRVAVVVVSLGAGSALLSPPPALAQHLIHPRPAAQLPTARVVTGVVYEAAGRPAAGVCVIATGTAGTAFARTALTGRYSLAMPRTGSYVLRYRACRSGAAVATRGVVITGASATALPPVTLPRPPDSGAYAAEFATAGVTVPRGLAVRTSAPGAAGRRGAGIHGKVTAPSGRPLKNICTWLIGNGFAFGSATAKNGMYFIPAQPSLTGRYPVEFTSACSLPPLAKGPWAPEWYKDAFSQGAATKVLLKPGHVVRHIDAVMQPEGVITGTVTGAAGRKLDGVCVLLTTGKGVEVAQAVTRANGSYRVVGLDPGRYRALFLGCRAADYATAWWPSAKKLSGARPIRVRLGRVTRGINARLVQLGTITGTVRLRDKHGAPLRGMCVSAASPNPALPIGFASTARNGTYAIPGLAAGKYEIFVNAGCNNNGNYASASYPRLVSVADGVTATGIDVYLQPGGIVSGTVTSAATGTPLAGVCVADGNGDFGVTSGSGTYRLDQLSAGSTTMAFGGGCGNGGSYAPQWYPGQDNPAAARTVTIRAGRDTAGVDAAMLPGATIAGQVTAGGKPARGVCVSAVGRYYLGLPLGDLGGQVITGKSGRYSIANLAPDDYAVAFFGGCGIGTGDAAQQWYPGQPTYATAGLVSAQAGETLDGISAAVTRGGLISGNVTDSSGSPVAQFSCVYALNRRTGLAGGNDTFGFGGGYTIFGLAPGRYIVEAQNCGGGNLGDVRYRSLVTVRAGHDTPNINLALPRAGSITGKITIRGTRAPARGVCVVASNADPLGGGTAVTSRDGQYRITGLSAGSYRMAVVTADGCESSGESLAPARLTGRAHVAAGRVTAGVNGSVGQGGSVAGVVTGPGGHAEPGICAEVYTQAGGLVSYVSTGRNGQYLATGLAPGRYDVQLGDPSCSDGPPGLASQWYDEAGSRSSATVVTVTADHVRADVNAVLGTDGTVSGSVTGPASAALTGICVSAVPVSRGDSTVYAASSGGSYTLAELQPGRYRVEFRSGCGLSGYKAQWWDASGSKAKATVITVGTGAVVSDISAVMQAG